ncbi:MAG: manganese efflux pump [Bacteroidales bacterium]
MMSLLTLILLSVALSMDCFAVSIACGMQQLQSKWVALKMALTFSVFHIGMISLGWALGIGFQKYIDLFDHWLAFGLLCGIGIKMIIEGLDSKKEKSICIQKWSVLCTLALATSIDAFVVGISLSLENVRWLEAVVCVGGTLIIMTLTGLFIGSKMRFFSPKFANILGGIILLGIGIRILLEHEYGFTL